MGLMPPPIDTSGMKDQLQQQAAAASPWQNMAYLMGQTPYTSRFGPTGTGFSMGGPGSEYYFNQWNKYNMTPEQLMYGLGTGALAGQSQGAHDWFSVEDPTAWQNILGQQGGFDWTQATADPTQIGQYLYNNTQLLGGGMTPQLWSLYNSPQIASSGGNPQGYGEGGAVTMGSWQDNPLYQNQAIQQFYQNMGWDMPTDLQSDPRYATSGQASGPGSGQSMADQMYGGMSPQQLGAAQAAQYGGGGNADFYANQMAYSQNYAQQVNAQHRADLAAAQQPAAEQTVPTTQAAAQTGNQVPTSATGPDQDGNYQMTPQNNPYGTPAAGAYTAQGGGGDSFMPGENTWPGGDWYPGMPGSNPDDPYGGWSWDPWQWFPPDWPGSSGGGQPPASGGGGQTPGTGTAGQNWGNYNPTNDMLNPETGFGPPIPGGFGGWPGAGQGSYPQQTGSLTYDMLTGMQQMLPWNINPWSGISNPMGAFYGDYASQFPGMYSDYMGGLQNLVAGGPYAGMFDPNNPMQQAFSYFSPGSRSMADLEAARMGAGMPTTAQGANAGLYNMLQQVASGQFNPATEGGGQYQDFANAISGGAAGQPGLQDWFTSILANGIPNQVLMEDAGNESINQYRNVGDILSNASPYLQSMFEYGPPGQSMDIADRQGLEGLQGQMTNLGRSATTEQQNRLLQMLAGGGLTPEYVSAMQNQVLEPAQKQLSGKLNQMAGGKANLGTSGESQWYNEQLAKDFTDQLTQTGFQNYNNALQQMGGLGQFATGAAPGISSAIVGNAQLPLQSLNNLLGTTGQNARGDYMTIPQSVNPIMQTMLQGYLGAGGLGQQGGIANQQLAQQLIGMGNQSAMGWDQQGLGALQGLGGMLASGYGQNLQGMGMLGNALWQPMTGAQGFLGQQMPFFGNQYDQMNMYLRQLLSGQQNIEGIRQQQPGFADWLLNMIGSQDWGQIING